METWVKRALLIGGATLIGLTVYYRDKIVQLIKEFEGFSATPYQDPPGSGLYTIGYGHQIKPGEAFTIITPAAADILLDQDTAAARAVVARYIKVPLNAAQNAALVSFVYNIGETQFTHGTVPQKINAGNLSAAADTMQQYIHAGGQISTALVTRRAAEAAPFYV